MISTGRNEISAGHKVVMYLFLMVPAGRMRRGDRVLVTEAGTRPPSYLE